MNRYHNLLVARLALTLVAMAALTSKAFAGQVTYFGQDASKVDLTNSLQAQTNFLATLSSHGTEDLEALAGVVTPTLTFAGAGISATTDFAGAFSYIPLAVSGTVALLDQGPASADGPAFNDTMNLSSPVTAFGSFFGQGGDGPANTLTLRLENTILGTSKDVVVGTLGPGAPFYNIFFFGVTDTDPFNRVTMIESYDFDGILLDNITVGHVVPEPTAWALLAMGGALSLLGRRVRRR